MTILLFLCYDLEYYLVYRYGKKLRMNITPDKFFLTPDDQQLMFVFTSIPIEYLVLERISAVQSLNPHVFSLIEHFFTFDRQFGNFYIYKQKQK